MEEIELENGGYKRIYYFRECGSKSYEYYINKNGSYHREGDKPAAILYKIDGSKIEEYYLNGEDVTSETKIRLKRIEILKQLKV